MMKSPHLRGSGRVPDKSTFVAVVTYEDGTTAYLWPPKTDDRDLLVIARERQASGEIPLGKIVSVRRAR